MRVSVCPHFACIQYLPDLSKHSLQKYVEITYTSPVVVYDFKTAMSRKESFLGVNYAHRDFNMPECTVWRWSNAGCGKEYIVENATWFSGPSKNCEDILYQLL